MESFFFATLNEGEQYVGTELVDPALRDRFYVILMDYLPNPVEREVLLKKTGVTEANADQIISAVNAIRSNPEMAIDLSTRTTLMIGEMMAAGASLRQALVTSLQTNKATLESILLSLQVQRGYVEKADLEYLRLAVELLASNSVSVHRRDAEESFAGHDLQD